MIKIDVEHVKFWYKIVENGKIWMKNCVNEKKLTLNA